MYTAEDQKRLFDLSKVLLNGEATRDDIDALRETIVFHEWKYYVRNDPVLSDYEYDQLYDQLKALETEHPDLISPDSPTQRVSSDLSSDFPSVKHLTPMLSLGNSYNEQDLLDFDQQIKKWTGVEGAIEYCVEPKFDGGSIALVYEGDRLARAATRGNGVEGEEITKNIRTIQSVPLRADFKARGIHIAEMRGEAVIRKDIFERMNRVRAEKNLTLFANPRNTAAGGLRTKDANETRRRGITAFVFQLSVAHDAEGNDMLATIPTHDTSIELCGSLGFKVPLEEKKVCANIEEAIAFCQGWEAKREAYPYEIDGMVIKVNNRELQEKCGYTAHHPRWAIAFKFKAKQATTKLLNVEYQVGKIGSITPVAKLDPVQLAGVTVSSVSLHNEEFIQSKDLRIGDTVLVERAGDVIPYIVKAMDEIRDGSEAPIDFPSHCPINESENAVALVKEEGEAAWRCPQCVCGAQDLQRIIFHVSKDAMDIDGFGKSIVERFYDIGWIRDISDVYNLDYEQIAELEGFGDRSAEKLRISIEKAKQNNIGRLLHSLSIHHLGKKVSKLLAERIEHVLDLASWSESDYTDIKDVGPVVAKNTMAYLAIPANIEMLQRMEARGVNLKQTAEDKATVIADDAPLAGKTILFTGTLTSMGRKEAQKLAEKAGAKNISAVSSNLNILVAGEKAGSKLKKAEALGTVEIWTEAEFAEVVGTS